MLLAGTFEITVKLGHCMEDVYVHITNLSTAQLYDRMLLAGTFATTVVHSD